jgi:hypothetical protein
MKSKEEEEEEEWNQPSSPIIPVPSSSTPFTNNHYEHYVTPQSLNEPSSPVEYNKDLDDQLTKLLKEKEKVNRFVLFNLKNS